MVLGIAKEVFQVMSGSPGELIKKGSGDVIRLSDLGHLAVDALMEPNVFDNVDRAATSIGTETNAKLWSRRDHYRNSSFRAGTQPSEA
jgi:hypothetical protein